MDEHNSKILDLLYLKRGFIRPLPIAQHNTVFNSTEVVLFTSENVEMYLAFVCMHA